MKDFRLLFKISINIWHGESKRIEAATGRPLYECNYKVVLGMAHLQGVEGNSLAGAVVTLGRIATSCYMPLDVIQMMIRCQYKTDNDFHRCMAWGNPKG
jgi:hypothetical protein